MFQRRSIQTFSEKVLYGRSMGWVLAFSSRTSPYVQLFWIWKMKTKVWKSILNPTMHLAFKNELILTFSKAHLSCVCSANLLMKASSLSGMMVLQRQRGNRIVCCCCSFEYKSFNDSLKRILCVDQLRRKKEEICFFHSIGLYDIDNTFIWLLFKWQKLNKSIKKILLLQ